MKKNRTWTSCLIRFWLLLSLVSILSLSAIAAESEKRYEMLGTVDGIGMARVSDIVARARVLYEAPLLYKFMENVLSCGEIITAEILEPLKGDVEKGQTIKFLSGGIISEPLIPLIKKEGATVEKEDWDLYPIELLLFLRRGEAGLDKNELAMVDEAKGESRTCVAMQRLWAGFYTTGYDRPMIFDRWAEKQFGGKWLRMQYSFGDEEENLIDTRVIEFGPNFLDAYGVQKWSDIRSVLEDALKAAAAKKDDSRHDGRP